MNDGVQWLPGSYSEGFCVAFCEKETSEGFIRRLGGNPAHCLMLTREQAEAVDLAGRYPEESDLEHCDLEEDDLRSAGFLIPEGEVIRVGSANGWAFAIQSFGSFLSDPSVAREASRGSRYISFGRTVNMAAWVQYAVDGDLINSFDPIHPVAGPSEGIDVEELQESADPTSVVLAQLEGRFQLETPRMTEFAPLLTATLGR
ncbi:DUF6461 domain-containing protein [Streptomyces sp. NPDC047065]|uniref:DUF6461 domain-containing protein n=1 Tax=Streptomyces sp. NPDC047065 TaxID=3154606 RepID=UPI0033C4CD90